MSKKTIKCKCGNKVRGLNQRNCSDCHNAYQRGWRLTHKPTEEQKFKDNCRSYASTYKKRGKLIQEPCNVCGAIESEMHHEDYSKPLLIAWLCRTHHLQLHKFKIQEKNKKIKNENKKMNLLRQIHNVNHETI